jgi:phenylalanyl-tRNA synthetase beta chain
MTVIADDSGVHDIAGIMGGEHSGVSEGTTDILLEIAYFDPERIGMTGRRLGLASDARTRFERGVDPAFLDEGLDLLTAMILQICGGEPSEVVRAGSPPNEPTLVDYDPGLAERLGGIAISEEEQRRTLTALEFRVSPDWHVTAPLRRHDIEGPADIVEEVVRIHGLDSVESVALPRADGVARPTATPAQATERKVRRAAAARGLNEAVTWSFIPETDATHFAEGNGGLWLLENPISEDMKAMRPSLIPGLLAAAKRNADRGSEGMRLFEVGRRYLRGEAGRSDERLTVGVLLAGEKAARDWASGKARGFDAFDAKAEALALLEAAGAPVANLQVMGPDSLGPGPQFHPGQSATLRLGPKTVLARFGALHPKTLEAFDIEGPVMAVEIYLDAIPAKKGGGTFARAAYSPPALQAVKRDFAFLVDATLPAGDLLRAVKGADKMNIVEARIFDEFRGTGVPEGKKSLAVEATLQPGEKSYTDQDLKEIADRIVAAAAKLGAELRG